MEEVSLHPVDGYLKRVKGIENAGRRVRGVVEMAKPGGFSA
jgi:hypothetical protein